MATTNDAVSAAATSGSELGGHAYVDWGAILAGAVFAAAISFLFLSFGAAVGLSATSQIRGEGFSASAMLLATGIWVLWVQVSAFMAGGYLVGRLRGYWLAATPHEAEMRDGGHGLLVWAVSALIGAYTAGSAAISLASAGASALNRAETARESALSGAAQKAASIADVPRASRLDPTGTVVDQLFRREQPVRQPGAGTSEARTEVARILASAALNSGKVSEGDRAYIAKTIAARTALSQEAAEVRVNQLLNKAELAAAKADTQAREAADSARRIAVISGFILAVSLLVSALAAWWGATTGGRHRDEGIDFSGLVAWR